MDKMEEWEVIELYDVVNYSEYSSWEQTRLLLSCYVDHKKVKKMSDIMKFPWDPDYVEPDNDSIEISNEQIKKLKSMAAEFAKNLSQNE